MNAAFFSRLYLRLRPHSRKLFAASGVFILLCVFLAARAPVRDDILGLVPTEPAYLAEQFTVLREAPVARMLSITVSAPANGNGEGDGDAAAATTAAAVARMLADSLRGPLIPKVITGNGVTVTPALMADFCSRVPLLMDEAGLAALDGYLGEEAMAAALHKDVSLLLPAGGIALRELVAMDPLGICGGTMKALAPGTGSGTGSLANGMLLSADGRHALVLAEPASSLADAGAAVAVMERVRSATRELPPGSETIVVGGHRHTEENSAVIQADLRRIMPASIALLALAFLVFVRTRQGLVIVLLPGAALAVAAGGTALVYGELSGIVLGFGSVVLGITADYAIHVYYAVRSGRDVGDSLDRIRLPLLLGAMTTLAAFAAFFASSIPAIMQMTWFAICGVVSAVALALVVLPHCLTPNQAANPARGQAPGQAPGQASGQAPDHVPGHIPGQAPRGTSGPVSAIKPRSRSLGLLWGGLLLLLAFLFYSVPVNGDVRDLSYASEANLADELRSRKIWGGLREGALFAVSGETLEDALEHNDRLWAALRALPPESGFSARDVFGLGPILPATGAQRARREAWLAFWEERGPAALARLSRLAAGQGFSDGAFAPFQKWIASPPPLITPDFFADAGFALPLTLIHESGEAGRQYMLYSYVPAAPISPAAAETIRENGAVYVSGETFREALRDATGDDILRFGGLALAGIVCMSFWGLRSLSRMGLMLLPVAAGLACVLAVFRAAGMSLNIFHAMALPLVMALSVDYGMFMLSHLEGRLGKESRMSVLLSGITTLSGFGVLMLAEHPALFSLGFTVSLGIAGALLAALTVLPFFVSRHGPGSGSGSGPGFDDKKGEDSVSA